MLLLPQFLSNFNSVWFVWKSSCMCIELPHAFVRYMSPENKKQFRNKIKNVNWTKEILNDSCQNAYTMFHNIFLAIYDTSFPVKRKSLKPHYKTRKPLLTNGMKCKLQLMPWLGVKNNINIGIIERWKNKSNVFIFYLLLFIYLFGH